MLLNEIANAVFSEVPNIPVVHGIFYEHKFINRMKRFEPITVEGLTEVRSIRIRGVSYTEMIKDLPVGYLYHLKFTYPVIDAVGYLEVDQIPLLVFVQVSLSPYVAHKTKLEDLFSTPAPEDEEKTILDYCKGLTSKDTGRRCSKISALYVYVTPPVQPSKKKDEKGTIKKEEGISKVFSI